MVRNLVPTLHAKQAPEIRLLAGEQSKDYRPTAKDTATYLQHAAKRFPDLHDAAVLGFEAGPRLKELRSLKIEDVHLQAVGSKTGYVYFRAADADPSNRAVPLTDAARRMLARRLAELAKRIGNHKTKWLFPSPRNGARPIAHKTIEDKHLTVRKELDLVRRETPRLCRGGSKSLTAPAVCFSIQVPRPSALRLGACDFDFGSRQGPFEGPATRKASGSAGGYLHPRFTCHTWRHEFCSRLGDSGAQAPVIMMLAGHRSLATSQKYVHITAGRAEDAILKMNTKLMATVGANTPYNFNYSKKSDNVSVMS